LRPILRRLAHVGHIGEAAQVGELLLDARREQSFVNADVLDAVLERQLVPLVGDLFVVHAPGVAANLLVGVIADRVALD
jgi:hypothetical protein